MLNRDKISFRKLKAIIIAISTASVIGIILMSIVWSLNSSTKERERLATVKKFIGFQSDIQELVYDNITLLKGFEAYIMNAPDLEEKEVYEYLEYLLTDNMEYIRNVGIIQDTTIIWNYPKTSNASAIGVDLGKVETQRDLVLKVKREMKPVVQGPVELVQGGVGFIVRIPLMNDDGGYWGQISIVLKGESVIKAIGEYAQDADLDVAIYNLENNTDIPFWGSKDLGPNALIFNVSPEMINWEVHAIPKGGWNGVSGFNMFISAIFLLITFFSGILLYVALKNHYEVQHLSVHDKLTGLYNRNFLEEYKDVVFSAARRHGYMIGLIMMDLNNFKSVNDRHGHKVGDLVLIESARLLKSICRGDETVFRLGGDEFLIVITNFTELSAVDIVKDRVIESFNNRFDVPECAVKIVPSVGTSICPDDGQEFENLLHTADLRMYAVKRQYKSPS